MNRMKQYRNRIYGFLRSPQTRACLLATAIFGALSYLYLFVNNINNNDMIVCLPEGYGTGLTSGRWMLYFLGEVTRRVWGVYNVPVFNGVLALILLAFASAVLVCVLELKQRGLCFALAAITAVFAPIGSLMFFGFTAHYYALAIVLMALATYLLKQRRWTAFVGGVLLAACSISLFSARAIGGNMLLPLALIPASVRACAGIAVLALSPMSSSQYSAMEKTYLSRRIIPLAIMLVIICAVPIILLGSKGLAPLAAALGYALFCFYGSLKFGGMSGDVSGFSLTLGELIGIAVLMLVR